MCIGRITLAPVRGSSSLASSVRDEWRSSEALGGRMAFGSALDQVRLSLNPPIIVDESLSWARSSVDRRRTRRVGSFGSRRSAMGRDPRPGVAARIGGFRLSFFPSTTGGQLGLTLIDRITWGGQGAMRPIVVVVLASLGVVLGLGGEASAQEQPPQTTSALPVWALVTATPRSREGRCASLVPTGGRCAKSTARKSAPRTPASRSSLRAFRRGSPSW